MKNETKPKVAKAVEGAQEPSTAEPEALSDVADLVRANRERTRAMIHTYRETLRKSRQEFPTVLAFNKSERKITSGRIPKDELDTLGRILDVIDADPAVFSSLAAKDHGKDANRVETEPSRHAIELLQALVPLVDDLATAHRTAEDLALRLGELVRSVTTPAYAIGNANAPINPALRANLAPVNDYYRNRVRSKKPSKGSE
jgi:hypothetical protein